MMPRNSGICSVFVVLFITAFTNVGFAADDKELTKIYDAYNIAAKGGDVDGMLAMRTAAAEKEVRGQIQKPENRDYFVMINRAQAPESYDVEHVEWSKKKDAADLYLMCQLPEMREIKRKRTSIEVLVTLKKEGGKWKLDHFMPLGEPSQIKRPKDLSYNKADANQDVTSASVAGRIVSITFEPDHTLIMVRVMDEEVAVFLPSKDVLARISHRGIGRYEKSL
jgi:hypothetical protein